MKKEMIPKYILIMFLFFISIVIFIQNFIFSSSFAFLSLRNIDDLMFQECLYKYHGSSGINLLFMNEYGYGWIFWFTIYVITYPAHILFEATGVAWPLIVLPRMYSLFLCIMCSLLCYKILSVYTKNEWIKMVVVFFMPLFPSGAFFAERFSTVPQVVFFSMMAVYIIVREKTFERKDLRLALCFFSLAMATKVSAVVIAPLLVMLILARYNWRITWYNVKVWLCEAFLAILVMAAGMSPIIVLAPLDFRLAKQSIGILTTFWMNNQGHADMLSNFTKSITITFTSGMAIFLCICLLILIVKGIKILRCDRNSVLGWDYIIFPFGYYLGMIYLSLTIPTEPDYVFAYATAISFVLPMGLLVFDDMRKTYYKKIVVVIMMAVFLYQTCFHVVNIKTGAYYNILKCFQNKENSAVEQDNIISMQNVVENLDIPIVNYYIDIRGPVNFYSHYEYDNIGYWQVLRDDLGDYQDEDVNLIVLSKRCIGFYSETEFERIIYHMSPQKQEQLILDRNARQNLLINRQYLGEKWDMIYEDNQVYMFVKLQ